MKKSIKFNNNYKRERRTSLRLSISILFIILMITTIALISFIVFSNWRASVDDTITKMKNDAINDMLGRVEDLVNIPLQTNEMNYNILQRGIIDMQNKNNREAFFAGVIKSSDREIYSFSYGMENGLFYGARRNDNDEIELYRSDDETGGHSWYYSVTDDLTEGELIEKFGKFDPRTRDWYIIAKEEGRPIFAPIYPHFVKEDLALSAAYPIYDKENNLQGVLGSHITLSRLNGYLEEIARNRHAIAYIIEKSSGELVANSLGFPNFEILEEGQYRRIVIEEIDNKSIVQAYEKYKNTLNNDFTIKSEGERYHIGLAEYQETGLNWLIIIAIPESFFTGEVNRNIWTSILLSILAVIISILIYIKNTKIILQPINNLIDTTENFSTGDLSQRAKIYRNDEIGKLANAFNHMADQLHGFIHNLEERVQERTLQLESRNTELKKSKEDIRLLLDSTAEGIYGIDMEGNCTFCNISALKILGYQEEDELIGKNMHRLIHHKNPDGTPLSGNECKIFKAITRGEGTSEDSEVFWRADGSSFPVEYFSYPQYYNGEIVGAVVTFMDITERKKAQNELIQAKEEAEAANIAKSQFLANMSHEIRTPMNGIYGFLQLLEDTQMNSNQREFMKMIKTSTDTLLNVINDILDISKIESGRMELEYIPFDLRSMIEKAVVLYDAKANEKGIELNMLISSNIPQLVIGDPTKLRQVIGNLISNAVKFTDRGEVFLEANLKGETQEEAEIEINVKDTGIGISKEELDKIFKPFAQADASSTRKYGGTGLGLTICKRMVELMGGEINVMSEKGKGTIFTFSVTVKKANSSTTPSLPNQEVLKGKHILIVDDNSTNRYIAKAYLEEAGCLISEAESAHQALNKLMGNENASKYDSILVDYQMNEMTGLDLSEILMRKKETKDIPLILITSVTTNGEAKEARTKGFAGYISKPYRRNELIDCVAMVLEGKQKYTDNEELFITRHTANEANYT